MFAISIIILVLALNAEISSGYHRNLLRTGQQLRIHKTHVNLNSITLSTSKYTGDEMILKRDSPVNEQSSNMSDEEEESEEEDDDKETESASESSTVIVEADLSPQISLIKQGLNISSSLNGTDVRVGIIMARWNADIIQGLYKVVIIQSSFFFIVIIISACYFI
jgi:hypothetical protein